MRDGNDYTPNWGSKLGSPVPVSGNYTNPQGPSSTTTSFGDGDSGKRTSGDSIFFSGSRGENYEFVRNLALAGAVGGAVAKLARPTLGGLSGIAKGQGAIGSLRNPAVGYAAGKALSGGGGGSQGPQQPMGADNGENTQHVMALHSAVNTSQFSGFY